MGIEAGMAKFDQDFIQEPDNVSQGYPGFNPDTDTTIREVLYP